MSVLALTLAILATILASVLATRLYVTGKMRKAEEKLVETAKMAVFGQMSASITHELKNPITGIVSLAQIARGKTDNPERLSELLAMIESEAMRCQCLLEDMLLFARNENATARVVTDVNSVVRDSLRVVEHQLMMNGVAVSLELRDPLPKVSANANQLKQVIVNLALNAQQAMPEGGKVCVRTTCEPQAVVISIEDDGPGIPDDVKRQIFEPFFTTKGREGTGLGLSVSQNIVAQHGGTLSVETHVGKGSRFDIRLPVAERAAA